MVKSHAATTRLLLIGAAGSEFRLAATMAVGAGACVAMADKVVDALAIMRSKGADLVMIAVGSDIAGFIASLRQERIVVPVFACGIDASAIDAVSAIRAGALDYVPLPPNREMIAALIVSVASRREASVAGLDELASSLAPTHAPLLIIGEPGSGKETLARSVYAESGRSGPFIVVDCTEIAPEMIGSELFGHELGDFPGAIARRAGRITEAAGGMIYLREIELLSLAAQSRLAAILENQVHSDAGKLLPARIAAGTSCNLDLRVAHGQFRPALLARLGLFRLSVPPLRQRRGDVARLAYRLAERFAVSNGIAVRPLTAGAIALLETYEWPGNVGELADVLHRAVLLASGPEIEAGSIVLADGSGLGSANRPRPASLGQMDGLVGSTVEDVERALILETLKRCSGNRTSASTILGISVRTMRNKLKLFIEGGCTVSPAL